MYKTKDVLAYWDYDRSYDRNLVIVQATEVMPRATNLLKANNFVRAHSKVCPLHVNYISMV